MLYFFGLRSENLVDDQCFVRVMTEGLPMSGIVDVCLAIVFVIMFCTHLKQATFGHPGPGHVPTHCLTHCEEGMHRLAADAEGRAPLAARAAPKVRQS